MNPNQLAHIDGLIQTYMDVWMRIPKSEIRLVVTRPTLFGIDHDYNRQNRSKLDDAIKRFDRPIDLYFTDDPAYGLVQAQMD